MAGTHSRGTFFFILKYIFKNKNAEKGRKINLGKSNIFTKIVLFSNLKIETVFFNWIRSQATRAPYYDKSQFDNQRKIQAACQRRLLQPRGSQRMG